MQNKGHYQHEFVSSACVRTELHSKGLEKMTSVSSTPYCLLHTAANLLVPEQHLLQLPAVACALKS